MNTLSPFFTDVLSPRVMMFCLDVGDFESLRIAISLLVSFTAIEASICSPLVNRTLIDLEP